MSMNYQLACKVTILGAHFVGMMKKEGELTEFLVMPSSADKNTPITIDAVVTAINDMIKDFTGTAGTLSAASVKTALSVVGLEDASVDIKQFYIHYMKTNAAAAADCELAIGIVVEGDPVSDDFKFIQLNQAYVNVWNTANPKILEKMKIWTTEQLALE